MIFAMVRVAWVVVVLACVPAISAGEVGANESVRIELQEREFATYEPIPIVLVRAFEGLDQESDADVSGRARPSAHQLLEYRVQLRDLQGEMVLETLLTGVRFPEWGKGVTEQRAHGFAFLVQSFATRDMVLQEPIPGEYAIVVLTHDRSRESNAVPIKLREHVGVEEDAAVLFRDSFPKALSLIMFQEPDERAMKSFSVLSHKFGETVYGKYARVALALVRFDEVFDEHNVKGGADVWTPVAEDLGAVVALFKAGHPVREKALYRLAGAQACAGLLDQADATASTLEREFPYGEFGRLAEKMKQTYAEHKKAAVESSR